MRIQIVMLCSSLAFFMACGTASEEAAKSSMDEDQLEDDSDDTADVQEDQNSGTVEDDTTVEMPAQITLYVGIQNSGSGGAFVQKLVLDTATNGVTDDGTVDVSAHINNGLMRGFFGAGEQIYAGDGSGANSAVIDSSDNVTAGPTFNGGTVTNVHGFCQLPGGNFVVGGYDRSDSEEYASDGTFVATVLSTNIGTQTECVAVSDTEVFIVDYDANADSDGDIVKVTKTGDTWAEVSRFDSSDALGNNSSLYSLVRHTNGNLYAPPQTYGGSKNSQMVTCTGSDLSQCAASGEAIPEGVSGFLQGAIQIPGSDNMVFATSGNILFYNLAEQTWTSIFDMSTLSNISQVRGMTYR